MTKTIRAIVYHAPGDIRVETIPLPDCGNDEIRVKVDACAVCGTDLKAKVHGNPRIEAPQVMGHEFTGLVETLGASAAGGLAVGDRVVMATSVSCGACYYCGRGWTNLCTALSPMGFGYAGGMAEFVTIPARALENGHVIKVPAGVKAEHAALAEPVSCTVNAVENCAILEGDTVVVIGAGPMGIMNACTAREFGAKKTILAEVNEARLRQAEGFGFEVLANSATDDLVQIVRDETDGIGADVVIVAAPAAKPQEQALDMVRKRGTVCLFASLPADTSMLSVNSRTIHYSEIRVVGSSDSTPRQVHKAVEMIGGGTLPVDQLATHVLALDEIETAYDLMRSGESLRVVLKP